MSAETRVLSRRTQLIGWLCAIGIALLFLELAASLPYMPAEWWQPARDLGPNRFSLREMISDPGLLGWIGGWGYLASFLWMPWAFWKAGMAYRRAVPFHPAERVLLALVPTLFGALQALVRLTPLRYAGYQYPLL